MSDYDWLSSLIRAIAVPLAVTLAFRYFAKKYPANKDAELHWSESEPVSAWWTPLSVVLWLIFIAGITFAIASAVARLNELIVVSQGSVKFRLSPTWAWWYLYGGFAGLSLGPLLMNWVMRRLMGPKPFRRWTAGHNKQGGFDTERAIRRLAIVIMTPYTLLFLPSIGCHTRFSETEIGIQSYADLSETRYGYKEVVAIAVIKGALDRSGGFYKDAQIVIDFADGKRWLSGDNFRDPEEINPDLAAFVALKAGRAFRYVNTVEDLK